MIPEATIQLIKDTAADNFMEVISDFVKLKKSGNGYVGLSPFNNERSPSFRVVPSKGFFKDFSSGNGGDAIKFLMLSQNLKYPEAIKYLAKKFSIDLENNDFEYQPKVREKVAELKPSFIEPSELIYGVYSNSPLFKYLLSKFDEISLRKIFDKYYIGCFESWVIFWQIDASHNIRSAKYIKYLTTGHRCKDTKATWHHSKTKNYQKVYPDFNLVQCFFGEHLIIENLIKPIAIVESEKTALIASLMMPEYIWLACGSKHGLNDIKCSILANRSVTLFPDLGAYDQWKQKAKIYNFNINNIIEKYADDNDRKNGLDLADFLLR